MKEIVVIGGGGHAKVIISILKRLKEYEISGYTDKKDKGPILGVKYLGDDSILINIKEKNKHSVLGIGQIKTAAVRLKIVESLKKIGYDFPVIIAPTAIINEDVSIAEGSVVMDGVVINAGTKIGKFSIINTNCSIDHDCILGDYNHIAPGVTLSGNVKTGDRVLLGTGSCVIQEKKIVSDCIVAAGSSVQKSLVKSGIYRGNPAKFIKKVS